MNLRIVVACALLGALAAGGLAVASERPYRARAFVIRLPPAYGTAEGLDWARSDPVLLRALEVAGRERQGPAWLRERSKVELTSRLDFAITVETPDREATAALATAYAKAIRLSLRSAPGLATRGRGARRAQPVLGPVGWALLGGAAGLWLGAALAIVLSRGSRRGRRRASAPCARGTPLTRG